MISRIALFLLIVLLTQSLAARDYFVSPDGDDGGDGSRTRPWRTVARANAGLFPGDSATFAPGSYGGMIHPRRSGEPGKPITYRSAVSGKAILTGGPAPAGVDDGATAILLHGVDYIDVTGFAVRLPENPPRSWMRIFNSRFCNLEDLDFEEGRIYSPVVCRDTAFCRFRNIRARRGLHLNRDSGTVQCDYWNNYRSHHNVYEQLEISRFGHRPLGFDQYSHHIIVRDSVFNGIWGRNFEFFSTRRVLFERNLVTNGYDGSNSADGRAKIFYHDSIFRRNLIIRNSSAPLVFNSYFDIYFDNITHVLKNNRFYHNTFAFNNGPGIELYEFWGKPAETPDYPTLTGNRFFNNLFAPPVNDGEPVQLYISGGKALTTDNRIDHNLIAAAPDDRAFYLRWPEPQFLDAATAAKKYPANFAANATGAPHFHDAARDDYRLAPGSAAIDRGDFLARTTRAGRSRTLPVTDATGFFDGFGIPGEPGDLIWIGTAKTPARVVACDLGQNQLTLDREVAFDAQAPIHTPYSGKAPDAGAYESGDAPAVIPVAAAAAACRRPTLQDPVAELFVADFEPQNRENWFWLWSFTRQKNSTAQADYSGGFGGSRGSYRVKATGDGSTLSTYLVPAGWEIARHPLVHFAYRIPAGTPVGIYVDFFDRANGQQPPHRLYIGGTANRATGTIPDRKLYPLIDDGAWHEITLDLRRLAATDPDKKMLRRFGFRTEGNAPSGATFQIDDFAIRALPSKPTKGKK